MELRISIPIDIRMCFAHSIIDIFRTIFFGKEGREDRPFRMTHILTVDTLSRNSMDD